MFSNFRPEGLQRQRKAVTGPLKKALEVRLDMKLKLGRQIQIATYEDGCALGV